MKVIEIFAALGVVAALALAAFVWHDRRQFLEFDLKGTLPKSGPDTAAPMAIEGQPGLSWQAAGNQGTKTRPGIK